jgi:hypothetical protein
MAFTTQKNNIDISTPFTENIISGSITEHFLKEKLIK